MPSRRAGLAALGALVAGVVPASAAEPPTPAERMIEAVNGLRAAHSLRPLRSSSELSRSSARFASRQIRTGRFGHLEQIRAGGGQGFLGEAMSIHRGRRAAVQATLRGWLRSAAHRPLLLSKTFREVGAGLGRGRYGGRPTTIWVLQLRRAN